MYQMEAAAVQYRRDGPVPEEVLEAAIEYIQKMGAERYVTFKGEAWQVFQKNFTWFTSSGDLQTPREASELDTLFRRIQRWNSPTKVVNAWAERVQGIALKILNAIFTAHPDTYPRHKDYKTLGDACRCLSSTMMFTRTV